MQYVRALHESEVPYFLYENNYSIHKNIKAFISQQLGVEPIIPGVEQPEDNGILVESILVGGGISYQEKSHCMTASYNGAVLWNSLERKQRSMVFVPCQSKSETKEEL